MQTSAPRRIGPFALDEHPARLPAMIGKRDASRHKVVIAGGGPVGLACALALANWGIASVVLEADTTVCDGSRAICISRRSLQILQRLDALDAHLDKGLPWLGGRTFHREREILHFTMPNDEDQKLPPMINIQQYWIEQFLVEAAARRSGLIDIRWGTTLTGFRQHPDGLELDARCEATDYQLDADWLIAADGGQSLLRKQLGLKLEGVGWNSKFVIVDVELPSPYPTERRAWFDPPSNPGLTVLMHRQPDDLWRIDYQIPDDADMDEALKPANVEAFVQRHLDFTGEGSLPRKTVWISAYRAGAMTLETYRHGRVLFAGNAAHALPIFGVRGLNSGLDDADNLGWKLAAVIHGWSDQSLLASYDAERLHAFRVNAAAAIQSTEFMAPPTPGARLMRDAALSLSLAHSAISQLANPRQTSVITYENSPLNLPDDAFECGPVPGAALLEAPVRSADGERHLTDLLGTHWTILVFSADAWLDPQLDERLRQLQGKSPPLRTVVIAATGRPDGDAYRVLIIDHRRRAAALHGADSGAVYLIRPDGHVAGRWLRQDDPALLEQMRKLPTTLAV